MKQGSFFNRDYLNVLAHSKSTISEGTVIKEMTKKTFWTYLKTENQTPISCELLKLNWLGDFKSVSKDSEKKRL